MSERRATWGALVAGALLGGCEDPREIRVYSVDHHASVPAPSGHGPGDGHDHGPPPMMGGAQAAELSWELPPGWQVSPEQRPMRWATLVAPGGIEAAVTRFPGDVGGPLANVNRWRGQVGLSPIGEPALAGELRAVEGASVPVLAVDLTGSEQRLLAGMLTTASETWFVKLQGPQAQVEPLVDGFQALLRSLRLSQGAGAPHAGGAPMDPGPVGPMAPGPIGPMAPAAGELPFTWTAPAGWEPAPASGPRLLSLKAPGGELSVTRFPGDVGGALPNVNRWRGQVGLPALEALPPDTFRAVQVGGVAAQLLELTGASKAQLVALVPRNGETWFFKLAGDAAGVTAERERFMGFLASVKWEGGR